MRTGRSTAVRGVLIAGATAGLVAALGSGSPASAGEGAQAAAAGTKTISMRIDARGQRFTGSSQVKSGDLLRIRNLSGAAHGGHTFTLVASNVLPRSPRAQGDACFEGGICGVAAMAHEVDEKTFEFGQLLVEAGQPGWDKRFSRVAKQGDSWYSQTRNEIKQVVSAKPGTVLRYMCIVHPNMQGKIKVVD